MACKHVRRLLVILVSIIFLASCLSPLAPTRYEVLYSANTGSGTPPTDGKNYQSGDKVTVQGQGSLTKVGYTFAGWNTAANGSGNARAVGSTFVMGNGDVTLYAVWTQNPTYTVTYDANTGNGTPPTDSNNYQAGDTVTVQGKGSLTNVGYTFAGWNTQSNGLGTGRAAGSSFLMGSANVILYAVWTQNPTHTVSYNANTGTGTPPTDGNNYQAGDSVTVLDKGSLAKTGYIFAGWNTQSNGLGTDQAAGSSFTMGSGNVTLYAVWTQNPTYTVTYNANTGSGTPPVDSNNYQAGDSVTVLDKGSLVKPGYTFAGWNTQLNGLGTDRAADAVFTIGSADVMLYAVWTQNPTYIVTYNANTGSGTPPVDSNNYQAGGSVTVLDKGNLTKSGYTFAGWNTQSNGLGTDRAADAVFTIGSADVTLYAVWTQNPTYIVTYNANTGSGTPPVDSDNYQTGDSVTVLDKGSLAKTGYTFAGWNTQANGLGTDRAAGSSFLMGGANVILYAVWTQNPTYTVSYSANTGTGTPPTDVNNYQVGDSVTVLDKGSLAKTGYTFAGWNTQANGLGLERPVGSTFAMTDGHLSLYAKWEPNTYRIRFLANGGAGSMSDLLVSAYQTTMLPENAFMYDGYTFTGWAEFGGGTINSDQSSYQMGAHDIELCAQWSGPGCEWTVVSPKPTHTYVIGMAYGNGTFAALVNSGEVLLSADGVSWESHVLPSGHSWDNSKISFGNGVFVISPSEDSNMLVTSSDGVQWNTVTLPVTAGLLGLAYGNGVFLGIEGSIGVVSVNGTEWQQVTLPAGGGGPLLYYWNGNFYVFPYMGGGAVSSDGVNWTLQSLPSVMGVDRFQVVGGAQSMIVRTSSGYRISDDGISWTNLALPAINGNPLVYGALFYHDGQYFASAGDLLSNLKAIAISNDGIHWFVRYSNMSVGEGSWVSAEGNGHLVAISPDLMFLYVYIWP